MSSKAIREKFLAFFKERGHAIVPSASLIPDDPSVLLTTAGMQPFKRYFTGELDAEKDFGSKSTASIQKSFRTSDLDEVGDESHLTFFEMLGNFSFGGYFKPEAIQFAYEFITGVMKLPIDYVSVFEGDDEVPADTTSEKIWRALGVMNIKKFGRADNFWGPTGQAGPCGPTTEIYVRGLEVWNIVFNEFYCETDKTLRKLEIPGVDTGMGLERLAMVAQEAASIYETDLFRPLAELLPIEMPARFQRIAIDHARAIVFLISDGVRPANKAAGYILRRLMRRLIAQAEKYRFVAGSIISKAVSEYKDIYPELDERAVRAVFEEEQAKFSRTLSAGIKEINHREIIDASAAFQIASTLGVPYEVIKEVAGSKAADLTRADFDKEFAKHREVSRAGLERKFGGHGLMLDTGELKAVDESEFQKVIRLHTATHILQAALRQVLGPTVGQQGSDVNAERTRFDFNFPRKLTDEEKREIEWVMSDLVERDLPVRFEVMPKAAAENIGALHFFKEKYPDSVKVYYIGDSLETAVSKEFCGGPHVERTGQIGQIKIKKEESIGAGLRRIKAVIE